MDKKLISLFLSLLYCSLSIGQFNKIPEYGKLKKETIRCINIPGKIQEIIYEYSKGNLCRIDYYLNSVLTDYMKIEYNQYGNEIKRVFYNLNDKITRTTLSIYDKKQRLAERKIMTDVRGLETLYEYDTLSRLIVERYFRDPNTNISCHYIIYEYSGENLVKKLFHTDCILKSYEINIYDEQNKKVKTEFYFYDKLTKYTIFKYYNNNLINEFTYEVSKGEKLKTEKEYRFNSNNQLGVIIENGKFVQKNHYKNKRLTRSENYSNILIPRPGGRCINNEITYEYYDK